MTNHVKITECFAREIINSQGEPTVEAEISTECGRVRASVSSGTSHSAYEAAELRGGSDKYGGMSVQAAVDNINTKIRSAVTGMNVFDLREIDRTMCRLDNSPNKGVLGANAVFAVSAACARAGAQAAGIPLYRYIGGCGTYALPMPMVNIISGGTLAGNKLNIREFMAVPVKASCFRAALRMSSEVYHSAKKLLRERGYMSAAGDDGGLVTMLDSDRDALNLVCDAVREAHFQLGSDIKIALGADSSEWYQTDGSYKLPKSGKILTKDGLADYWESISEEYPIFSIEDGAADEDAEAWRILTDRLSGRVRLVGGRLFYTNISRLKKCMAEGIADSILVKMSQAGTVTEALDVIRAAQTNGYGVILSHRTGETEDSFIADAAAGAGAGLIKAGAPARSERAAKYNRLLRIEEDIRPALTPQKKQ